jgi:hypothetical protein
MEEIENNEEKNENIKIEENKKHEFLVKNQIISYLYQNKDKIDNFKKFLIELYKDISWNEIVSKIKLESL